MGKQRVPWTVNVVDARAPVLPGQSFPPGSGKQLSFNTAKVVRAALMEEAVRYFSIALLACMFTANSAVAADYVTVAEAMRRYDQAATNTDKKLYVVLFGSTLDGLEWANAYLTRKRNQQPLYCTPKNLALTADQVIQIVRRTMASFPEIENQPIGAGILFSFQKTFPCNEPSGASRLPDVLKSVADLSIRVRLNPSAYDGRPGQAERE